MFHMRFKGTVDIKKVCIVAQFLAEGANAAFPLLRNQVAFVCLGDLCFAHVRQAIQLPK